MSHYIWLFGENLGETASNNSFYFWQQIVGRVDDIEKYLIMEKNPETLSAYKKMELKQKKYVVWRNSIKHFLLYFSADMFFVTLSYRDVRPEKYLWRNFNFVTETPVIYLQHGTSGLKKNGYLGNSYNNNIFRFFYYNPEMREKYSQINCFKDYQLYNGKYHPRYKALLQKQESLENKSSKNIFWFLTWRDYEENDFGQLKLIITMKYILSNKDLTDYLENHNCKLKVCFHRAFDTAQFEDIWKDNTAACIDYAFADKIDIMDELAKSDVLITDYSSVGYDFTFLEKPVVLFMPDLDEYSEYREFYCDIEKLREHVIENPEELVRCIINEDYGVNPFFRKSFPEKIDYDGVRAGTHIEKIYADFASIQKHKITFIGYNFYGIGGTVLATKALAEALLEKGFLVSLQSLVERNKTGENPYGLNMKAFYSSRKTIRNYLKRGLFKYQKNQLRYLRYDASRDILNPYAGYGLKKWLHKAKSETVISTRESLHLFLHDADSEMIKNKLYFYHCPVSVFDQLFPDCMNQLKKIQTEKAIFVSENNCKEFENVYGYHHFDKSLVLGNALWSSRMIEKEDILPVEEKEVYRGIYLLRISTERKEDIQNLLEYGRYLKRQKCRRIVIDVYGTGNYLEEFYYTIIKEGLDLYIHYCGLTTELKEVMAEHDAVVDFSTNHSFGMPYIEGVLNGKMVFCMENPGSLEVMKNIPDAFIQSFDDLTDKMLSLPKRSKEELVRNYDLIAERYSRSVVADRLIDYINKT